MTRKPRQLVLGVAATLLALIGAAQPVVASPAGDYAAAAFRATNARRIDHDLRRLTRGDCVQDFARRQAVRMAAQRRMFHQDLGRVLRSCNLVAVGENVAYGYPSGGATVRAWMRSPGHRANILGTRYRGMGLAARRAGGVWYVAQVFGRHA